MRIQYQKPKWGLRSKPDAHAEKALAFQQHSNYVTLARNWALIGLLALGLMLLIIEARRPEVILEPIEVPEDIAKLGYSGIVVAEQLADAALDIELETQELSSKNSWHKDAMNIHGVGTNARIQDISVPGSPFTIRSIARFI